MNSLRRGETTDAWENGVNKEMLKVHGSCWRSDAISMYLQAPIDTKLKVTGHKSYESNVSDGQISPVMGSSCFALSL